MINVNAGGSVVVATVVVVHTVCSISPMEFFI